MTRDAGANHQVLSLRGVTKRFSGLVAVDDVSFDIGTHETLGLIGPNGSGKTTLINLLSGMLKPSAGEIRFLGDDLAGHSATSIARRGVARTFQIVRTLPSFNVRENVEAGGVFGHTRYWGAELRDQAMAMLEKVGVTAAPETPVDALTYIDQKRVELARALMSNPKLLLLDEWLAGLNPTELLTGIALIEDLRAEGRTIIVVEHVMDAIRSLCDRCVVLNSGVKIAEGTPSDVLADPHVVEAYLGSANA